MRTDETRGLIVFDRLVSADRDLGSAASITCEAAECAVAVNAKGAFATKNINDIHASAKTAAANLRAKLTL